MNTFLSIFFLLALAFVFSTAATCGNGARGDGVCSGGLCCSKYGWCGSDAAHCDGSHAPAPAPAPAPARAPASSSGTCGGGKRGNGVCSGGLCCSQYGWCGAGSTYCTSAPAPAPAPGPAPAPAPASSGGGGSGGNSGVSGIISEATFDQIFPNRNPIYTYSGLIQACQKYSSFGGDGSSDDRKREVAAFLAHVSQESGHLLYTEEIMCAGGANAATCSADYNDECGQYQCGAGQIYYGRGPLQISHPYNYHDASVALFGDIRLLQNANLVSTDASTSFQTALWFWMTRGCHTAINSQGFGATTKIINGGLECPAGASDPRQQSRVQYFQQIAAKLGVSTGSNLYC